MPEVRTVPLSAAEFRAALRARGLTQRRLAQFLGVSAVTVNRWALGALPVPRYAACVLDLLAAVPEAARRRILAE